MKGDVLASAFRSDKIFSYNIARKRLFIFAVLGILSFILFFTYFYIFHLQHSENLFAHFFRFLIGHFYSQMFAGTLLGAFYVSFFGGLFVLFMPLEIVFLNFLRNNNVLIVLFIYMFGLFISYNINYFIGMRLSSLSQKIISAKKFYKIKGVLNRYGALAIFLFNLLPLPSQPLSAILGVFRYNRIKFYFLFLSGQSLKYLFIILGYIYI